jgi:glycosyltransferase involved in cell wall biosynthesis
MKNKKLSVLLPNYNYAEYIEEALDAIVAQSYRPDEVLIIDDASSDNSVEIIKRYVNKYPFLRLIENKNNMGAAINYKKLVEMAEGEYIYCTASDDRILPGFFEKSMALLEKYPQAGLCCTDTAVQIGKDVIENRNYLSKEPRYFSPKEVVNLFARHFFTPVKAHTVVVKRSAFVEAGNFRPELKWSCDSLTQSVVSFRHGICYCPEVLTVMRMHKAQYGYTNAQKGELEREVIKDTIELLKSKQYKDVLPMFKKTAPFSAFPWEVLRVVLASKAYRDYFSIKLLRYALFDRLITRAVLKMVPLTVSRRLLAISRKIKDFLGRGK